MRHDPLGMESGAVESMQNNLRSGEPLIMASYGLVGAIVGCGGVGLLLDHWLQTRPWCLLAGLFAGLVVGFLNLAQTLRTRTED